MTISFTKIRLSKDREDLARQLGRTGEGGRVEGGMYRQRPRQEGRKSEGDQHVIKRPRVVRIDVA